MASDSLVRVGALLSGLLLLAASAAEAWHHREEDCARHDCAACAAGSLTRLIGAHSAPNAWPTAVRSLPPGPQGLALCALYRDCLPSRAPPFPACSPAVPLCGTISFGTELSTARPMVRRRGVDDQPPSVPTPTDGPVKKQEENTR